MGADADTSNLALQILYSSITQIFEVNSLGKRLPFEIEHAMNGLDLYPPASSLHRLPNQYGIVTMRDYILITIFHVSILKWNSVWFFLVLSICNITLSKQLLFQIRIYLKNYLFVLIQCCLWVLLLYMLLMKWMVISSRLQKLLMP